MPPTPKIEKCQTNAKEQNKIKKIYKNVKMDIFKNMSFLKVSAQTDFRFEFSVNNCIF